MIKDIDTYIGRIYVSVASHASSYIKKKKILALFFSGAMNQWDMLSVKDHHSFKWYSVWYLV